MKERRQRNENCTTTNQLFHISDINIPAHPISESFSGHGR